MKQKIQAENFFHFSANNVGDQVCGPANYFPQLNCKKRSLRDLSPEMSKIIVGGGLVFNQLSALSDLSGAQFGVMSKVSWGVGIPPRGKRDEEVARIASRFDLFGTRNFDWADELEFVPCVSCMSDHFNGLREPSEEVVVFAHQRKTPDLKEEEGVPFMLNTARPFGEVLRFLARGETVVTSSYHGVYWAQLLGRKVICVPYGNKFQSFQFPPHYATGSSWRSELQSARQTAPLLEPYRELNLAFYRKVLELWEIEP